MHYSRTSGVWAAALLLGSSAWAENAPNPLSDRFQVTIGAFFITTHPTIRLDGESGAGDRVNWRSEFGDFDAHRVRLECHWRFSERQKLRGIFFGASRERSEVLDEDIDWGDETFPVHAQVDADLGFTILEVAYEHTILRGDNYELDLSLGLHYTRLEASLEAEAEASGGTLSEDLSETARLDAPLPAIGLGGMWSLPHDLWLDASAQFFALSIDDYDGNLQSYRASVTWQPKSWLGIGVGYSLFTIDVDVDNQGLHGTLDWLYQGPTVFYRASF